jgi:WD40 repeat protein
MPHRQLVSNRIAVSLCAILASAAVFAAPPSHEPQLVLSPGFHSVMIRRVSASADGTRLLTSSDDKTARLYDGEGRLLRVFRVPRGEGNEGKLYSCALSSDGALAAIGGYTGWDFESACSVFIYDTSSGALLRRIGAMPSSINGMAFSPPSSGPILLACSFGGSNGVRIYDPATGAELFRDASYGSDCYCVAFSPYTPNFAVSSYDGAIRLYKRSGSSCGLVQKAETKSGSQPFSLAFGKSKATNLLAVGYSDSTAIDVYNVSSSGLAYAYSPDKKGFDNGNLSKVAFMQAPDGSLRLVAGGSYGPSDQCPLIVWEDAGRGARRSLSIGSRDTIRDIQSIEDGSLLVGGADPFLTRLNTDFKQLFTFTSPLADFRDIGGSFALSQDGTEVSFSYKVGGKESAGFSLAARELTSASKLGVLDVTSLDIRDWKNNYKPTLKDSPIVLKQYERSRSLAIAPDKKTFLLGTDWNLRCYSAEGKPLWSIASPGSAWGVAISGDGRLGAAAYADGTIRWYRMDTGAELLAFFPHTDKNRWVAWTPSGYFMASSGAEELIGWHVNNGLDRPPDFYPASRFRSAYYRPDVVALELSTLDEKAALARADAEAGRKAETASILTRLPPTITIVSPASGSSFTGASVRLVYRVSASADAPVTGVRALVDGRPAPEAKGIAVAPANNADIAIDVELPPRSCAVSLIADNKNGSSEAATVRLSRSEPAKASAEEFVIKPKLYVLAVGVSAYANPDYRLAYAAKDARDLAAALEAQKGGVYRDVELKVLADADATKDDILDGLDWIQRQTTGKDVAIMFFSGHGINDASQNYYFLPVGTNLDSLKRTGVPFSDITTTVSAIAGKVLFFIDTCHSGNLMKGRKAAGAERDIVAVVNELASAENGAVVFASSTGNQYSYEDPSWGNGAFTKALIEGLSGQAAYGSGNRVTVNMLDLYISERVKALTGGKQTPTTTKPANVPDFPVSIKAR